MKHNQHKTKHERVSSTEKVIGNPTFGHMSCTVASGHYTPKQAHERKRPSWCKLNKKDMK